MVQQASGTGIIGQADSQVKINWDDSDVSTTPANVFNVTGTREEIVFLFGQNRMSDERREAVQLTNRIVLSPFTAKRLLIQLKTALRDYASKYGPVGAEAQSPADLTLTRKPSSPATDKNFRAANFLFRQIQDLGVVFDFERSFKITHQKLLRDRFLLFLDKQDLAEKSPEQILGICQRLGMPHDFRSVFEERLPQANPIDFGFEADEQTCTYKIYLDFLANWKAQGDSAADKSQPYLMFLGFKWNPADNTKKALTKYTWYPSLAYEAIEKRISTIFGNEKHGQALEITNALLKVIANRVGCDQVYYLDVTEARNPRRSFDLNAYSANLTLQELYPILMKMCRYYEVALPVFDDLYKQVETRVFGHVSGGIGRDGQDFLTVYFGLEPIVPQK